MIGISPDDVKDISGSRPRTTSSSPLVADKDHKVAEKYGTWVEKSMYGNKYMGVQREQPSSSGAERSCGSSPRSSQKSTMASSWGTGRDQQGEPDVRGQGARYGSLPNRSRPPLPRSPMPSNRSPASSPSTSPAAPEAEALRLARRGARVTGYDGAPRLLQVAGERAAAEGLELERVQGDLAELPAADDSFEIVTSVFGLIFTGSPQDSAAEIGRVLRPRGRIAFTSWVEEGLFQYGAGHG